jgi:hypothetical protein
LRRVAERARKAIQGSRLEIDFPVGCLFAWRRTDPTASRCFFGCALLASSSPGGYYVQLMNKVTQLLSTLEHGDPHAASRRLPLAYHELRKLAALRTARSRCPAVPSSTPQGDARR